MGARQPDVKLPDPCADHPELGAIDVEAFARELDELQARLRAGASAADLRHLRKIERWGRLAALLGYATAWIAPNPVSIFALSFARFVRWTAVAHPVCHRGYDKVEGAPEGRKGAVFARGWRRAVDWLDWIDPAAWHEEHNLQHHYRLNEEADPDLVERNLAWFRESRLPRWLRRALVVPMAMSWKWVYYAPSTLEALARAEQRRATTKTKTQTKDEPALGVEDELRARWSERGLASFLPRVTATLWRRSWAPYFLVHFVAIPALFVPLALWLGPWVMISVLLNTLFAELLTNVHAFVTIVPNHAGADLYRFEGRTRSRAEFYLRQVLGSANYRCGDDRVDVMHGWLNYQIEHHLFPDMSLLQYRRAQPEVEAICARHGVPYVQESVWTRCGKAVDVMVGDASMRLYTAPKGRSKADRPAW